MYNIVIIQSYTLQSSPLDIFSTHLAPYMVIAILLTIFPMLHFISPWLFCNYQSVLLYPLTLFTQSPKPPPLKQHIQNWTLNSPLPFKPPPKAVPLVKSAPNSLSYLTMVTSFFQLLSQKTLESILHSCLSLTFYIYSMSKSSWFYLWNTPTIQLLFIIWFKS